MESRAGIRTLHLPITRRQEVGKYQGALWGRVRCSARTATAATAMKVSKPSGHSQARIGLKPAARAIEWSTSKLSAAP
jgi:hypothetical protein